eukprot:gene4381-11912_t
MEDHPSHTAQRVFRDAERAAVLALGCVTVGEEGGVGTPVAPKPHVDAWWEYRAMTTTAAGVAGHDDTSPTTVRRWAPCGVGEADCETGENVEKDAFRVTLTVGRLEHRMSSHKDGTEASSHPGQGALYTVLKHNNFWVRMNPDRAYNEYIRDAHLTPVDNDANEAWTVAGANEKAQREAAYSTDTADCSGVWVSGRPPTEPADWATTPEGGNAYCSKVVTLPRGITVTREWDWVA